MTSFATHSKKNNVESSHQSIMTVVPDARMLFRILPCIKAGHPMAILCSIISALGTSLNSRDECNSSQPASVTLENIKNSEIESRYYYDENKRIKAYDFEYDERNCTCKYKIISAKGSNPFSLATLALVFLFGR